MIRRTPVRQTGSGLLLLVLGVTIVVAIHGGTWSSQAQVPDLSAACGTLNPFLAVTRFAMPINDRLDPAAPSVVVLHDTMRDDPETAVTLATQTQTGAVFGLAYDATRQQVYTAAYYKRFAPFGPAGPGGIYRIDLATGAVNIWASLAAGQDRHDMKNNADASAEIWVGRSGLGDIDVAPDGSQLFVANMFDGRIHRLSLPDGTSIGSFRHGGNGQIWQGRARLFALAVDADWLYHGVMDTGDMKDPAATAHIYRSRWDGTEMTEMAAFSAGPPQAFMLADLGLVPQRDEGVEPAFLASFRRGWTDTALPSLAGLGTLQAPVMRWDRALSDTARAYSVTSQGGLAQVPGLNLWSATLVQSNTLFDTAISRLGIIGWLDGDTPDLTADPAYSEPVTKPVVAGSEADSDVQLGDVETLCPATSGRDAERAAIATAEANTRQTQEIDKQTAVATATAEAFATRYGPTLTAFATAAAGTQTAVAATVAALPPGTVPPGDLTRYRLAASCGSEYPAYAISIFAHAGPLTPVSDLQQNNAILAFNGWPKSQLSLADQSQTGAIYGLAYDYRHEQLFAGAYIKQGTVLGSLGPGGIYRIDLHSGLITPWALLPAGPDLPDGGNRSRWVGRLGLGDIDLSDDGTELYATDLFDGRIYRLSISDGRILGSFSNGGTREAGPDGARPMGLGVWGDQLYHGVVSSNATGGPNEAAVYVSRADGSDMRLLMRLDLSYRGWPRWDSGGGAMLSDIAVRKNGDILLGLRDRWGDTDTVISSVFPAGDLIIARQQNGEWVPDTSNGGEFYQDDLRHPEPLWGGLALSPLADRVVSSVLDPFVTGSGGAAWFDNNTGQISLKETLYHTDWANKQDLTFSKVQGLGDIESLCPPPLIPTFTPAISATPTASATLTLTSTATVTSTATSIRTATASRTPTSTASRTPSVTATATATSIPGRVYLPLLNRSWCLPKTHVDVVLVLDMSTSMERLTRNDRTKHAAAVEAARNFVQQMDLRTDDAGRADRAAVVGFNDAAWTAVGLTHDPQALEHSLASLEAHIAQGTRLDLAILQGQNVLGGSGLRGGGVTPVIILMTDGLPNRVPTPVAGGSQEDTILAAATSVKTVGTRIFTVGLGEASDVLDHLLRGVASAPDDYTFAPDGEDLAAVYMRLAGRVHGCE